MPRWEWYGAPTYRYRDEQGHFASQADIWKYGQQSIDSRIDEAREAALTLPPSDFENVMRQLIKGEVVRQYVLGKGGVDNLTQVDYGVMGGVIADQYRYLDGLMAKYEAGEYSPQKVAALAEMYINSCREAYERANARVRGLPLLPSYPGDGKVCKGLTRCKCHWEYHFRNGRWECYWVLGVAEHCDPCLGKSTEWSPLLISKEGEFI